MSFSESRKSWLESDTSGFDEDGRPSFDKAHPRQILGCCSVAYFATAFVGIGGSLFGYDIGIISGVLAMQPFISVFADTKDPQGLPALSVWRTAFIVTLFIIGNFFGAVVSSWIADKYGRRSSLSIGALIFLVGGTLQCFAYQVPQLYIGRLIAGFAIGILTAVVPLFNSELAPPEIRGRLITFNQIAMTGGIMVAFWVNYALQDYEDGWRYALAGQCVPALVLLVGCLWMPRSPRWLVQQGLRAPSDGEKWITEAREVLQLLRSPCDDGEVEEEIEEIKASIATEYLTPPTWGQLAAPGLNRRRLIIAVVIQSGQNLTGINAIMYYAPSIFSSIGFANASLLAQGINGVLNFIATFAAFILVDRFGRRTLLVTGGIAMGLCMATLATLGFLFATDNGGGKLAIESSLVGYVCIVSIYIYVISFAYSWGPVCWLLPTEIFPLAQRAKGVSITTGANFFFNFCVGQFTPWALENIHFGLFYFFAFCLGALCLYVSLELPETKGVPLEQIASLFEPGIDWRAQREILADEGPVHRRRTNHNMPTSESYDDLLSATMVKAGKTFPRFNSAVSEEALLNPASGKA